VTLAWVLTPFRGDRPAVSARAEERDGGTLVTVQGAVGADQVFIAPRGKPVRTTLGGKALECRVAVARMDAGGSAGGGGGVGVSRVDPPLPTVLPWYPTRPDHALPLLPASCSPSAPSPSTRGRAPAAQRHGGPRTQPRPQPGLRGVGRRQARRLGQLALAGLRPRPAVTPAPPLTTRARAVWFSTTVWLIQNRVRFPAGEAQAGLAGVRDGGGRGRSPARASWPRPAGLPSADSSKPGWGRGLGRGRRGVERRARPPRGWRRCRGRAEQAGAEAHGQVSSGTTVAQSEGRVHPTHAYSPATPSTLPPASIRRHRHPALQRLAAQRVLTGLPRGAMNTWSAPTAPARHQRPAIRSSARADTAGRSPRKRRQHHARSPAPRPRAGSQIRM